MGKKIKKGRLLRSYKGCLKEKKLQKIQKRMKELAVEVADFFAEHRLDWAHACWFFFSAVNLEVARRIARERHERNG